MRGCIDNNPKSTACGGSTNKQLAQMKTLDLNETNLAGCPTKLEPSETRLGFSEAKHSDQAFVSPLMESV